jgi:hypothetical protein
VVSVFPITYFGNIQYYRQLLRAVCPIIETREHFIKQTNRTRCEILTSNGVQQLSIPVMKHNGSKTPLNEVEISQQTDWQKIHWRGIESAYSSAPFFDHYGMEIEELIFQKEKNLIQFNLNIMYRVDRWLELNGSYSCSDSYISENIAMDHRSCDFSQTEPIKKYVQVFEADADGSFVSNLSILDLIFNEGPLARNWLIEQN